MFSFFIIVPPPLLSTHPLLFLSCPFTPHSSGSRKSILRHFQKSLRTKDCWKVHQMWPGLHSATLRQTNMNQPKNSHFVISVPKGQSALKTSSVLAFTCMLYILHEGKNEVNEGKKEPSSHLINDLLVM